MEYVRRFGVYGYMIVYKKPSAGGGKWTVDQDDEYRYLPAHYLSLEEAVDRVEYLRTKAIEARVAALMAEDNDEPEEFEANRTADEG